MPNFLDLYRDRLDAGGITEDQYLTTDPGNFVDQLEAQWDAAFAPDKALYSDRALSDRYDEALQIYEKNTGQKLESPYRDYVDGPGGKRYELLPSPFRQSPLTTQDERGKKRQQIDQVLLAARQQYPDIPDVTQFDQEIADRSTALRAKADRLSQESVGYGGLGAFIGSAAGETVNPINLAALPFGGGPTAARTILGRILVTAGREGGLNAGAQVVVETLDYGSRKKFGTEQSFDEAAGNVLTAFGGGVVLGSGSRAAGEAFKATKSFLFGPARKIAAEAQQAATAKAAQGERPSLPERDATVVLEAEAFDEAAQGERLRLPTGGIQEVLPHENLKRGREAAARVLDTGEDVPAAMYRSDLGEITFNFGEPGNPDRAYRKGSGLSHVRDKRTNIDGIDGDKFVRDTLPEILAYGKLETLFGDGSSRRARITYKGNEVRLSLFRKDQRETWVITGYKTHPKQGKGSDGAGGGSPTQAYAPEPLFLGAPEGAEPTANIQSSVFQRNIFTPAGRQIEVNYDLADAANLISSHDDNLNINAAFPSELQPRDRTRAASEAQITTIAANLAPERLAGGADAGTGAPIIGPDGVVESGNGRVLAIRRAYRNHPDGAKHYRDYLESLGFDTTGIEAPVLVRRRTTALSPEERVAFAREANESATLTLGASERAAADARALPVSALELYRGGDINLARNRDFVKQFMNIIPESERGAILTKDGSLSQAGIKRIESALLFKAYGDSGLVAKLTESPDNDIKAIGGALTDIAPAWAQMRARVTAGEIVPEMDITADLLAAVRTVEKARAEGHKVGDLIAQGGLFGEGISEKANLVLRSFYRDANFTRAAGRDAVAQRLAGYIDEANKAMPGPNLLGLDPVAPEQILARQTAPNETPVAGNLFAQPKPQAPDLPVTEHGTAAPDTNAALYADVERVLADKDLEIAIEQVEIDGQSLTKTISARDYLKQLDEGIRAAAEVAACAGLKGTTA